MTTRISLAALCALVLVVLAAPRNAPVPAQSGAPRAWVAQRQSADTPYVAESEVTGSNPVLGGQRASGAPPLPAVASQERPAATVGSAPEGASSVQFRRLATDAASEPAPSLGDASLVTSEGIIGYAVPALGRWYLALPDGPGVLVTICGPAGCVERTSTDAGPSLEMQREPYNRIADLNSVDWQAISGVELRYGLTVGTITVIRRPR